MVAPDGRSELEDVEDALVDGDLPYQRGTAAAALRHRDFRIVYVGTFSSNIGTWMQNVILGEFALNLTHNGAYVGLLYFGQLGPLLFLSMMGGLLADRVDRRRLLVSLQVVQGLLSFALAAVAWTAHPSTALIAVLVFAIGIANALGRPGTERDPAHTRSRRGPERRSRAHVGADEPVARHRSRHRRPDLRRARCRSRVRDQRRHVRVRGHRPRVGPLPAVRAHVGGRAPPASAARRGSHRAAPIPSSSTCCSRCSRSRSSPSRSSGSCPWLRSTTWG